MRVLVLFAHPAFERSRVNRALLEAIRDLDGISVRDLYELYPDFDIDVEAEQRCLAEAELLVVQHPLYWYSTPAILKEWQDLVLEHGWAYGSEGHALEGKWFLSAITTGGRERTYGSEGSNRYTVREFLRPLEQTARLCGMRPLPPFVVHGTHRVSSVDVAAIADDYRRLIEALRDDKVDAEEVRSLDRINADLGAVLGARTG